MNKDFLGQIKAAKDNMAEWPQWMRDAAHFAVAALQSQKPIPDDIASIIEANLWDLYVEDEPEDE